MKLRLNLEGAIVRRRSAPDWVQGIQPTTGAVLQAQPARESSSKSRGWLRMESSFASIGAARQRTDVSPGATR